MIKKLNLAAVLISFCLSLSAQTENHLSSLLEKRKGAEAGAKPCRYDDHTHPSILVTPKRMELIRKEILAGKTSRKAIYEKYVKAEADRWLQRSIVIPQTGGWIHDFFCTDGSILEVPENRIFNPEVPSRCPVCGKTYLNEKIIAARRSFENYWLCGAVRDLSLVYAIEGKKQYAQKAIEILEKYADAYPKQAIQRLTLEEAVVLIPLAEGYDLLYNVMTNAQRSHIEKDLFWPAAQGLTKAGMGGNWGSWHLSAIGVIGYATRHQRFIDFATQQFKAQIANQLGDDGLWPESISTYHFYPLDGFLAFIEAAANNGDDLANWEAKPGKGIKAMFTAPLRYAYPNMRLAAINDGWYDSYLPQDQYTMAYYLYRLPEFAWAIEHIRRGGKSGVPGDLFDQHYRNLLYGEALPAKPHNPTFSSTNFPVLGIATLRQGSGIASNKEMMMTFDYGPLLAHGQPDKMGITLFANGKLSVPDYGTTGYGSALDQFLRSTPAHNTVVVDGKDQPKTRDRNLVAFKNTPSFKLASARTTEVIPGTRWTRTVMMTGDYAIVWDRFEGTEEHQYDWFFHAEGNSLSLPAKPGNSLTNQASANQFSYKFITDVKRQSLSANSIKAEWQSNDGGIALWFMNDPKQVTFTSRMPTAGGKQVPLLVLRQKSADAEFVAVIKPLNEKAGKEVISNVQFQREPNDAVLITVSIGKQKEQIYLQKTGVVYQKKGAKAVSINLPAAP